MENLGCNQSDARSNTKDDIKESAVSNIMSTKKILLLITLSITVAVMLFQVLPVTSYDFFSLYKQTNNASYNALSSSSEMYSVVFDAGSTGSRVFVFHFKYEENSDDEQSSVVKLHKETFMSTEPGISYYAYNPHKAADSLRPLLLKAVHNVPSRLRPKTLLLFKATAGMRLLSRLKGEQILSEVKNLFLKSSPFYLPNPEDVEVMGGSEEGIFGWLTVNFLEDTIWDSKPESTVAAIDLGGGSLQITFEIPSNTSPNQMCDERLGGVYLLKLFNVHFNIHTHSFLGFGLKSAYLQIMGGTEGPRKSVKEKPVLTTPCFEAGFESTWHHGGRDYIIRGQESNESRMSSCQHDVDAFVKKAGFLPHPVLAKQDLHLFSYFYDIARWAGILSKDSHQVLLTPADFYASAEQYCQSRNFTPERPFHCMNLLYVHSILTKGLKLSSSKLLHVEDQISDREVSWALGSALASLPKVCSYSRLCSGS